MPSWLTWVLVGLAAIGLFLMWPGLSSAPSGPALVIEGQKVSQKEFSQLYDTLVSQYQRVYAQYGQDFARFLQGPGGIERKLQLQSRVLDDLVRRHLIAQEVQRRRIVILHTDIDDQTEMQFEQILRQNGLTEEEAEEILREQGRTLEGFKTELRQAVQFNMQTDRLRHVVAGAIEPSDQELSAYLEEHRDEYDTPEQVHARHILIRVAENAPETEIAQAKKYLEDLKREIESGADFAELAQKHSQDPGSASNGGDLGFFGRGQMVKEFEDAAFALEPGQVSDPVRTQFGFHLIKVEEKRAAERPTLSQIRERVLHDYREAERERRFEQFYNDLKARAQIFIADPVLRVFYVYEHAGKLDEAFAEYAKLRTPHQKLHQARVLREKLEVLGANTAQALALKDELIKLWLAQMTQWPVPAERSYFVSQIMELKPNELPDRAFFRITVGAGLVEETIPVIEKRLKEYGISESVVVAAGGDQIALWVHLKSSEQTAPALERLLGVSGKLELKRVLREGAVGETLRATGLGEQALTDRSGRSYIVAETLLIDKIEIKEVSVQTNPVGGPAGPIVRVRLSERSVQQLAKVLSPLPTDQTLAMVMDNVVYGIVVLTASMRELLGQPGSVFDMQFEDAPESSLEETQALALALRIGPLPTSVRVDRP